MLVSNQSTPCFCTVVAETWIRSCFLSAIAWELRWTVRALVGDLLFQWISTMKAMALGWEDYGWNEHPELICFHDSLDTVGKKANPEGSILLFPPCVLQITLSSMTPLSPYTAVLQSADKNESVVLLCYLWGVPNPIVMKVLVKSHLLCLFLAAV